MVQNLVFQEQHILSHVVAAIWCITVSLRVVFVSLLSVLVLSISTARADWINLTGAETSPNIAEIYILDDHVKLVLEVYIGDLEAFDELIPDVDLGDIVRADAGLIRKAGSYSRPFRLE